MYTRSKHNIHMFFPLWWKKGWKSILWPAAQISMQLVEFHQKAWKTNFEKCVRGAGEDSGVH